MARIIKANEQTMIMEIGRTELHIYVQSVLEKIDAQEIEDQNDQALVLMAMSGIEPLVPFAAKDSQEYYKAILDDVISIEWEDNNEETNEEDSQENEEESSSESESVDDGQTDDQGYSPDDSEM